MIRVVVVWRVAGVVKGANRPNGKFGNATGFESAPDVVNAEW